MNIVVKILLILLLFFMIVGVPIILTVLYKRKWPIKYTLKNVSDIDADIEVYWNSTKITDLNIKPNQVRTVILGDIKTINPRTGKEYTRSQTKSISIYLKNDYNINFSSSNLPKYTLVQSANISGLNPISTKPGMLWTKAGYYVFNFE